MTSSIDYLKMLIEKAGDDWKKKLDSYLEDDSSDSIADKECRAYFQKFINAYKEEVIGNKTDAIKKTEKLLNNDLLYSSLKTYIDNSLALYYAGEPLRILEIKDIGKAYKLVDLVFEQAMLRYNPQIANNYEDFYFESKETFVSILNVFESLCTFIISHNLYHTAIVETVSVNLRLSEKLCQYISDMIDKNFEHLQIRMLVEKLYSNTQL